MPARDKFLKGLVDTLSTTRAKRAAVLEAWAEDVRDSALVVADTVASKAVVEFADRRDRVEAALTEAPTSRCAIGEERAI